MKRIAELKGADMKYLCLGYLDRERMDAAGADEVAESMGRCAAYLERLYEIGSLIMDAGLEKTAKCLRHSEGKVSVTDGPFAEAKEIVGGAFIIEAEDLDEAVRIASLHPAARSADGERFGWRVEVRPVHYYRDDLRG